ncbi:Anaerobic magnesium-protoporphyrin IX monomethyl ester cyclase [subsurface metagenome]
MFIERGYHKKLTWMCSSRADLVDEPLLEKMREAGCSTISFGIETASQRLLGILKKGTSLEINERAVRMAKKAGISNVRGTFILGIPTETREESLATIKYAKKLPLDSAKFSIATPYPGTELYRIALSEGMDVPKDWSKLHQGVGFSEYDPVWIPKGRDAKELKKLQRRAHLEFYLSPRRIFYIPRICDISWKEVKSWEDIRVYWRIAKSLFVRKR